MGKAFLQERSLNVIDHYFRLSYAENTGAAFSQFSGQRTLLILIALLVVPVLLYMMITTKNHLEKKGLFLVIAGATGNLIDRVFRGYVIDFIDVDIPDLHFQGWWIFPEYHLIRWPVFNSADIYIFIGTAIIVYSLLFLQPCNRKT